MRRSSCVLLVVSLAASMAVAEPGRRAPAAIPQLVFPPVDVAALVARDLAAGDTNGPVPFAEPIDTAITPWTDGSWEIGADGSRSWALRLHVPSATDINLGFTKFDVPDGAALTITAEDGGRVAGPYAKASATDGQLWTPALPGDRMIIELTLPAGSADPELELGRIGAGYRDFGRNPRIRPVALSGACNNDVVCPVGDPWRDDIDSVAVYSISGFLSCTGTLVMDVPRDFRPYFLTANHCGVRTNNAATVITYWNFQTTTCAGPRNGQQNQSVSGTTFRARRNDVDFCLLELSSTPPASFNPYWAGWDRTDTEFVGSVSIHHPNTDEKAITFNDDLVTHDNSCIGGGVDTHWFVDNYEDGTTEAGSSGGGIWNANNHRLVGFLSGGAASCSFIDYDCYGRFSVAWNGATSADRLRDWLDPAGTNPPGIDGSRLGGCTPVEIASTPPNILRVTKGAARAVQLTFFTTTPCGGSVQVWMSPQVRPAAGGGSFPTDPPFTNVTAQDTDAGPGFRHVPPAISEYYLIVEVGSPGTELEFAL